MFVLFIVVLMISTFVGKCDANEPNSVEKMMIRICVDMLGITGKRGKLERVAPLGTAWHGLQSLYRDKAPLEDAIRLHILLKAVAGTTDVHRGMDTFYSYLDLCEKLVTDTNFSKFTEEIKKIKENREKHKAEEKNKNEKRKAHKQEEEIEDDAVAKDVVSGSNNSIETVLTDVGLATDDWQNIVKAMPQIIWKHDGDIKKSINLSANPWKFKFEKPFEKFGYDSQIEAENGILAAFHSVIQNSPENEKEGKKENLFQLCIQIEKMAFIVYEKEMEGKKEGTFCGKIKEEEPNKQQHKHQHGMPSHSQHNKEEEIE